MLNNSQPVFVSGGQSPSWIVRLWRKIMAIFWPAGASLAYKIAVLAVTFCILAFGTTLLVLQANKTGTGTIPETTQEGAQEEQPTGDQPDETESPTGSSTTGENPEE